MKDIYILGIETSCDETSMAIVKNGSEAIAMSVLTQIDVHAQYGGVVPEIASRMHTEYITLVLEDLFNKTTLKMEDMSAIAVTYTPGLLGSLLIGLEFAKTLALVYGKPLIKVHHLAGHIYANNLTTKMTFPLLALVVSGGHTELILMKDDYQFQVLGATLDDAIGECYDKVAKVLDMPYPGGPSIDKAAQTGEATYNLPNPMQNESLDFSYSGLKSAIVNLVHNTKQRNETINKEDLAYSFQTIAVDQLVRKTQQAIKVTKAKRLIVAGGVSANQYLRNVMKELAEKEQIEIAIPELKYCTDNGAMIAAAAYPLYLKKDFAPFNLNAEALSKLAS